MKNKWLVFFLAVIFILPWSGAYSLEAEGNPIAVDLSRQCHYEMPKYKLVTDVGLKSSATYSAGEKLTIRWNDSVPVRSLLLQFSTQAVPYQVSQFDRDGVLLQEENGTQYLNNCIIINELARKVVICSDYEMTICNLKTYGQGMLPNCHPWEEKADKVDYMLVATHPDDDILFLGAVIPYYEGNGDKTGVEVFTCSKSRMRHDEAMDGAWEMGLRREPIFLRFSDSPSAKQEWKFPEDEAILKMVRLIRQYRPEVVVTQDEQGEYGHWQHVRTVSVVRNAIRSAADPSFDEDSYGEFGIWMVKKLYLHLFEDNILLLDMVTPLQNMGMRTPVEVAEAAYQCHKSQVQVGKHTVKNEGIYDLSRFGLAYSLVGVDTSGKNDMFEHIEPFGPWPEP